MVSACDDKITWHTQLVQGKYFVAQHTIPHTTMAGKVVVTTHEYIPDQWFIFTTQGINVLVPQSRYQRFHYHDKITFKETNSWRGITYTLD